MRFCSSPFTVQHLLKVRHGADHPRRLQFSEQDADFERRLRSVHPLQGWEQGRYLDASQASREDHRGTTITHMMDRVFPEDKMTFGDLVKLKGLPLEGCYEFVTTPNPGPSKTS